MAPADGRRRAPIMPSPASELRIGSFATIKSVEPAPGRVAHVRTTTAGVLRHTTPAGRHFVHASPPGGPRKVNAEGEGTGTAAARDAADESAPDEKAPALAVEATRATPVPVSQPRRLAVDPAHPPPPPMPIRADRFELRDGRPVECRADWDARVATVNLADIAESSTGGGMHMLSRPYGTFAAGRPNDGHALWQRLPLGFPTKGAGPDVPSLAALASTPPGHTGGTYRGVRSSTLGAVLGGGSGKDGGVKSPVIATVNGYAPALRVPHERERPALFFDPPGRNVTRDNVRRREYTQTRAPDDRPHGFKTRLNWKGVDNVSKQTKSRLPIEPTTTGHDVRPHGRGAPLQGTTEWQRVFLARRGPTPTGRLPTFIEEIQAAATAAAGAVGWSFRPPEYKDKAYGEYGDQWYERFGHQWPPCVRPEEEVPEPPRTSSRKPWVPPGPDEWPNVSTGELERSLGAEAGVIGKFEPRGVGRLPVERRLPKVKADVRVRREDGGDLRSVFV